MKTTLLVCALIAASLQSVRAPKAETCGAITTLFFSDPLECSLDLHTGASGLIVQDGVVYNRDSQVCMGYAPDCLAVAIQGGDSGAIVDMGTLDELGRTAGVKLTGNGGNVFVALPAEFARSRLENLPLASTAHAPIRSGHVYLARIVSGGKPDIVAKLLVLEFRPGESVTFRWQRLEG